MNKRIGTHTHTVDIITLKSVLMGEDRFMACQKPSMNSMPNSFGKVYGVSVGSTQYLSTADFPRSMNAPEHSNRHADARICGLLPVCTRCTKTFIQEENDSVWYSDYFANIAFNRYYANYCTMNLTYTYLTINSFFCHETGNSFILAIYLSLSIACVPKISPTVRLCFNVCHVDLLRK